MFHRNVAGLTGGEGVPGPRLMLVARYRGNGTLDTTFDGIGKVVTSFGSYTEGHAVGLTPEGDIVVAGKSDGKLVVARYRR